MKPSGVKITSEEFNKNPDDVYDKVSIDTIMLSANCDPAFPPSINNLIMTLAEMHNQAVAIVVTNTQHVEFGDDATMLRTKMIRNINAQLVRTIKVSDKHHKRDQFSRETRDTMENFHPAIHASRGSVDVNS